MAENTKDLTQGAPWKAVMIVSAPMTLGIFAVLSVGIADSYFLGQVGQTELAAVGYVYPVTAAITSLSIGLSAGANTVLSQAIGAKEGDELVRRKALQAVGLGTIAAVILAAIAWIATGPLFGLMGADDAVMDEIREYMLWWAPSYPFLVAMMISNAAFRAHGDGMTAATIMFLSALVNVALNPVFIFGIGPSPEMGTGGAGLATFVARAVAAVGALWWAWRQGMIGSCGSPLQGLGEAFGKITKVGGPAAFSNAINPAGMAAVTAAVATLGEAAVAGFGAATRVQSVAIVALLALSSGIGPVVGQNWGAGSQDRARSAVRATFLMCVGYGLLVGAVLFFFADPIAALIANGGEAADYTAQYLRIVGWTLGGYGILVTANAAMNARDKALWSMSLSLTRILILYLPLAWAGVVMFGYSGIVAAAALSNMVIVWGALVACRATGLLETDVAPIRAPAEGAARITGA